MKLFKLLIILYFLFPGFAFSKNENKLNNLSIIVSSYDKFHHTWKPFFHYLYDNWPSLNQTNKHVKLVLVTNEMQYPDDRVISAMSPANKGWNGNVHDALKKVNTEYVLYLQDDYFMRGRVDEDAIIKVVRSMQKNNLDYVELYPRCVFPKGKVKGSNFLTYKDPSKPCQTTLQAAIWKTKVLSDLTGVKTSSIWAFEDLGAPGYKFAFYNEPAKPLNYYNFMYRGKINFIPFCWYYYKSYDLSLLDQYQIHPKYKLFKTYEWYRRNYPNLSGAIFYSIGWFKDVAFQIRFFFNKLRSN